MPICSRGSALCNQNGASAVDKYNRMELSNMAAGVDGIGGHVAPRHQFSGYNNDKDRTKR